MGFIQIIGLIISLLSSLPKIIGIVKSIIDAINGIQDKEERKQALKTFKAAVNKAKASGDTKDIDRLYVQYVSSRVRK